MMQQSTVQVPGAELTAWHTSGARPPLVCVHGAGVSSRELVPFVSELDGIRETWSVDLPGFGASRGPNRPLGCVGLADSLEAFRQEAGLGEVHLLGCSFGCQVAVELARRSTHVRSLILMGLTVDPHARSLPQQIWRWLRNARYEPKQLGPLTFRDYRDAGARRVLTSFVASLRDHVEDKLPSVLAPTLVVRGERDMLVPQEWAEEATRLLPYGELVVFPAAAHMVPFIAPAEFSRLVEDFLAVR